MADNNINMETTLRDYLRIIFSHKIVFIIAFVIITTAAMAALEVRTPVYTSSVQMLVVAQKNVSADFYGQRIIERNPILNHSTLVTSKTVLERVVRALELDKRPLNYEKQFASKLKAGLIDKKLEALKRELEGLTPKQKEDALFQLAVSNLSANIQVQPIPETDIFQIIVSDFHPSAVTSIANSVSRSYVIYDLEQQIVENKMKYGDKHSANMQISGYIKEFEKHLDGKILPDLEAMGAATIRILSQAKGSSQQIMRVGRMQSFILAAVVSMLLSGVLAFGLEYLDQTIKSPQEVEKYLNLSCLGSIPKLKSGDKISFDSSDANLTYSQAYQNLHNKIYGYKKEKQMQSFLIADVEGSGESAVVTANLGSFLSQKIEREVLIIDANIRNSSMSRLLNISAGPGLVDVLANKVRFEDAVQVVGMNLFVLPAGNTDMNPALLDSVAMSNILKKAGKLYEIIFICCAGVKNFTDAGMLSSVTDGTVLVINERELRRQVIGHAITPLIQNKINIIGVILNNHKHVIPRIIYNIT